MVIRAPFSGSLEWRVRAGASVREGDVLAWLSVKDHCAVRPVVAPRGGVVRWRRSDELFQVEAGEPLATCSEDLAELSGLARGQRDAARRLLETLLEERAGLEGPVTSPLGRELVSGELQRLERRLQRVRLLCEE